MPQPDRAPILAAGRGRLVSPQWDGPEPAGTESRIFRPVDLSDLADATIEPPESVVDLLVHFRTLTLFAAHGGTGKTILALTLAAHVAVGRPWAGLPVKKCRVVFLSLEDPPAVNRWRLRKIIDAYDLPAAEVGASLAILDGSDCDGALAIERAEGGVRRLVTTAGMAELDGAIAGAGLFVIDNASDAYGGDEIQRRQVRAFVRHLAQMAARHDAAVLLLAHIDKAAARHGSNGESYSGSTAWHNSARSRIALVPTEESGIVELRHEKSNYGPKADTIILAWDGTVLVPVARDRVAESFQADTDADAVLELVAIAHDAGITVPAAMSGPRTALHVLEDLPEYASRFQGSAGKKRAKAAVTALLRDKRLLKVEYRTNSRHVSERLEPAGTRADDGLEASERASSSARVISPIPPSATRARLGGCADAQVPVTSATRATRATRAEPCPRCAGEGCPHCQSDPFGPDSATRKGGPQPW